MWLHIIARIRDGKIPRLWAASLIPHQGGASRTRSCICIWLHLPHLHQLLYKTGGNCGCITARRRNGKILRLWTAAGIRGLNPSLHSTLTGPAQKGYKYEKSLSRPGYVDLGQPQGSLPEKSHKAMDVFNKCCKLEIFDYFFVKMWMLILIQISISFIIPLHRLNLEDKYYKNYFLPKAFKY